MGVEPGTGYRLVGMTGVLLALLVWVVVRGYGRDSAKLWCSGGFLFGLSFVIMSFRDALPAWVGFQGVQFAYVVGTAGMALALRMELASKAESIRPAAVGLAFLILPYLVGFHFFLVLGAPTPIRLFFVHSFQVLLTIITGTWAVRLVMQRGGMGATLAVASSVLYFGSLVTVWVGLLYGAMGALEQSIWSSAAFLMILPAQILGHAGFAVIQVEGMLSEAAAEQAPAQEASISPHLSVFGLQALVRERSRLLVELERASHLSATAMFSAAVLHELRQPLLSLGMNVHFLRAELRKWQEGGGKAEEGVVEAVEEIVEEHGRALSVLSGLRELYLEAPGTRGPVDLHDVVQEVVDIVGPDAKAAVVAVEAELTPGNAWVRAHPFQMHQVLLNLLTNAIRASAGSGTGRVRVVLESGEGQVELRVEDSGEGIPEDLLWGEFRPLMESAGGGMGLGLSISQAIVSRHGGTLTGTNSPDGGAVFRVRLPLAEGAPA